MIRPLFHSVGIISWLNNFVIYMYVAYIYPPCIMCSFNVWSLPGDFSFLRVFICFVISIVSKVLSITRLWVWDVDWRWSKSRLSSICFSECPSIILWFGFYTCLKCWAKALAIGYLHWSHSNVKLINAFSLGYTIQLKLSYSTFNMIKRPDKYRFIHKCTF